MIQFTVNLSLAVNVYIAAAILLFVKVSLEAMVWWACYIQWE